MRTINRGVVALALCAVAALSSGCATPIGEGFTSAVASLNDAKVSPAVILAASNSFDAVQVTAENYLRLPSCKRATTVICREPAATKPLGNAILAGRKARDAAQDFLRSHPDELGPKGLYDALMASVATARAIFNQYNVQAVTR